MHLSMHIFTNYIINPKVKAQMRLLNTICKEWHHTIQEVVILLSISTELTIICVSLSTAIYFDIEIAIPS